MGGSGIDEAGGRGGVAAAEDASVDAGAFGGAKIEAAKGGAVVCACAVFMHCTISCSDSYGRRRGELTRWRSSDLQLPTHWI